MKIIDLKVFPVNQFVYVKIVTEEGIDSVGETSLSDLKNPGTTTENGNSRFGLKSARYGYNSKGTDLATEKRHDNNCAKNGYVPNFLCLYYRPCGTACLVFRGTGLTPCAP